MTENHVYPKKLYSMANDNHLPHAITLAGKEGTPLLQNARDLITYLHCSNKQENTFCNRCASCSKMQKLIHPDLHCVFPMISVQKAKNKETNNTLVDWQTFLHTNHTPLFEDWCNYLGNETGNIQISKEQVHHLRIVLNQKAFESQCRTILLWLPEKLHPSAANAMLKMVEEPTSQTFFIFVTHNPHLLLPTLKSRTWTVSIPPPTAQELYEILLQHHPDATPEQLAQIINIVQGNLNLAQKLLQEQQEDYFQHFVTWMRNTYIKHHYNITHLAETFHNYPIQIQKNWIAYGMQLLRNTLFRHCYIVNNANLTDQESDFCHKLSQVTTPKQLENIIQHLVYLYQVLQRNANPKLAFLYISFQTSNIFSQGKKHKENTA